MKQLLNTLPHHGIEELVYIALPVIHEGFRSVVGFLVTDHITNNGLVRFCIGNQTIDRIGMIRDFIEWPLLCIFYSRNL